MPLGYKVVNGYYEIDEATAPIVREIFAMYIAHMGYTSILRFLEEKGIKSPRGQKLGKSSLLYILTNEKYIGTYTHNRTAPQPTTGKRTSKQRPASEQVRIPGGMPAIIDMDTWEKAQAIRSENRRTSGTYKGKEEFLLAGLCYCGVCGSRMVVDVGGYDRNGTPQRYYTCKKRCVKAARKEQVEAAAFAILDAIATDSEVLEQACTIANNYAMAQTEDNAIDRKALEQ